jgi:hypothetical protein
MAGEARNVRFAGEQIFFDWHSDRPSQETSDLPQSFSRDGTEVRVKEWLLAVPRGFQNNLYVTEISAKVR